MNNGLRPENTRLHTRWWCNCLVLPCPLRVYSVHADKPGKCCQCYHKCHLGIPHIPCHRFSPGCLRCRLNTRPCRQGLYWRGCISPAGNSHTPCHQNICRLHMLRIPCHRFAPGFLRRRPNTRPCRVGLCWRGGTSQTGKSHTLCHWNICRLHMRHILCHHCVRGFLRRRPNTPKHSALACWPMLEGLYFPGWQSQHSVLSEYLPPSHATHVSPCFTLPAPQVHTLSTAITTTLPLSKQSMRAECSP